MATVTAQGLCGERGTPNISGFSGKATALVNYWGDGYSLREELGFARDVFKIGMYTSLSAFKPIVSNLKLVDWNVS